MTSLLDRPSARERALVTSGAPVVLCVNPVEYHGPHLSVHNDGLLALGLARLLVEGLQARGHDWPWLLAGELGVGVDPVKGPGSELVPYSLVQARLLEACQRLHALGVQRVILATFHGSPLHNLAIQRGARWLEARGVRVFAPMNLLLRELMDVSEQRLPGALACVADQADRLAVAQRLPFDVHAGFLETSLALLLAPETVGAYHLVPPCPGLTAKPGLTRVAALAGRLGLSALATELHFMARGLAWYGLRPFPGYAGAPHLASAEAGQAVVDELMPAMVEAACRCLVDGEVGPGAALSWLGPVTLWGRIPRTSAVVTAPGSTHPR